MLPSLTSENKINILGEKEVERTQSNNQRVKSGYQHSPCAIHSTSRRETVTCKQFLQKGVEEKRKIVKTN